MGLGATVAAIVLKVIPLDPVWVVLVLALAILVGILWSTLGPASKPRGNPPWRPDEVGHRPDWDAEAAPEPRRWRGGAKHPAGPITPDVEPLRIQPLDVEPIDLDPPTTPVDTPTTPVDTVHTASEPVDTVGTPSETLQAPAFDPPRTTDPPPRSTAQPPPPPPPTPPSLPPRPA